MVGRPEAGVEDGAGSSEEESAAGGVTGDIDGGGVGCVGAGAGAGEGGLGIGAGRMPSPARARVVGEERLALMIEIFPEAIPFDCGRNNTWKVSC